MKKKKKLLFLFNIIRQQYATLCTKKTTSVVFDTQQKPLKTNVKY